MATWAAAQQHHGANQGRSDLAEAARACSCRVRDIGLNLAAHLIPFPERRIARSKRARCR